MGDRGWIAVSYKDKFTNKEGTYVMFYAHNSAYRFAHAISQAIENIGDNFTSNLFRNLLEGYGAVNNGMSFMMYSMATRKEVLDTFNSSDGYRLFIIEIDHTQSETENKVKIEEHRTRYGKSIYDDDGYFVRNEVIEEVNQYTREEIEDYGDAEGLQIAKRMVEMYGIDNIHPLYEGYRQELMVMNIQPDKYRDVNLSYLKSGEEELAERRRDARKEAEDRKKSREKRRERIRGSVLER